MNINLIGFLRLPVGSEFYFPGATDTVYVKTGDRTFRQTSRGNLSEEFTLEEDRAVLQKTGCPHDARITCPHCNPNPWN